MSDMAQFITAIPKAELHVHIEGTIEADLLLTIADRNGIVLPYKSAADILAGQNKGKSDPKQNLDSFCRRFGCLPKRAAQGEGLRGHRLWLSEALPE